MRIITDKGVGSGFIVSEDGIVITANHVVDTATTVTVALADGRQVESNVRGRDFAADVAVITLGEVGLATVPFGDSDSLQVGDTVIKIGFGEDLPGGPTVTTGIVSALRMSDRFNVRYLQTDAPTNLGDSGMGIPQSGR